MHAGLLCLVAAIVLTLVSAATSYDPIERVVLFWVNGAAFGSLTMGILAHLARRPPPG